jgi:hypothetical protein
LKDRAGGYKELPLLYNVERGFFDVDVVCFSEGVQRACMDEYFNSINGVTSMSGIYSNYSFGNGAVRVTITGFLATALVLRSVYIIGFYLSLFLGGDLV